MSARPRRSAGSSTSTAPKAAAVDPVEPEAPVLKELDAGAAGSSARREHERRKANDEARLRAKWGRLGGVAVALSDEKQTTKAWATGAVGDGVSAPDSTPWSHKASRCCPTGASPGPRPTSTTSPSTVEGSGSSTPSADP